MENNVIRIVGIDFGTSTSVVRVKRYKNGEPVGDSFSSSAVTFGGDNKAVTAVCRNGDGTYTCGREAEDMAQDAEIFREFKMELESPDEAKRAEARKLTEEYFRYLYRWYEHQRSDMGEAGDTEKTIVSFPVKWAEETREFMKGAAQKAGFPNVSSMDEPSAALYATLTRKMNDISSKGLLRSGENGYMLMVDMGAGTTDLAVCRYNIGDISGLIKAEQIETEIIATWPESADAPTFGGREVDRLLEDYLTDYLSSCGLDGAMARNLACSSGSVKGWKEETVSARLGESRSVDTCGFISGYMMLLPMKKPFPSIDRAKLESLLGEKLEGFKSLIAGCLDRTCELEPDIAQNGLDLVILTGGHSAWYFTEELMNGTMSGITHPALKRVQEEKGRVMRLSNPQETVALGLVYSLLPVNVEKQEKANPEQAAAQEELVNTLKAVAEKKSVFDQPITGPGQIQSSFDKPNAGRTSEIKPIAQSDKIPMQTPKQDLVNISLTRKVQWSGAATKIMVQVNRGDCYEVGFGGTIVIPVHPGRQMLTFWFSSMKNWKCNLEFEAHRDMNLTVKCEVRGLLGNVFTLCEGARIVASGRATR